MTRFLFCLGLLFVAGGCDIGDENPLKKYPKSVQEGELPGKPLPGQGPIPQEAFVFSVEPNILQVYEGEALHAKVSARVVVENQVGLDVELLNPPTGAVFAQDALEWTPGNDFVRSEQDFEVFNLKFRVTTQQSPFIEQEYQVPVRVYRKSQRPEVLEVTLNSATGRFIEDSTYPMTIKVLDLDSIGGSSQPPRLVFVKQSSSSYVKDASALISFNPTTSNPYPDPSQPGLWIYRADLDLIDRDVTASQVDVNFGVMAVSRYGVSSLLKAKDLRIYHKLNDGRVSWNSNDKISFSTGEKKQISFVVIGDDESSIELRSFTGCPSFAGSAQCSCSSSYWQDKNVLYCKIIAEAKSIQYERVASLSVSYRVKHPAMSQLSIERSFTRELKVLADPNFSAGGP